MWPDALQRPTLIGGDRTGRRHQWRSRKDYNNTKGRCCTYEVVGELEQTPKEKNHWGKPLVDEYEPETVGEWDNDDFWG